MYWEIGHYVNSIVLNGSRAAYGKRIVTELASQLQMKYGKKQQLYDDSCKRNAVEGSYGTGKRKYGLGLIMTKLFDTTKTAISFGFFVKNMEHVLRLSIFALFVNLAFMANQKLTLCIKIQKKSFIQQALIIVKLAEITLTLTHSISDRNLNYK